MLADLLVEDVVVIFVVLLVADTTVILVVLPVVIIEDLVVIVCCGVSTRLMTRVLQVMSLYWVCKIWIVPLRLASRLFSPSIAYSVAAISELFRTVAGLADSIIETCSEISSLR